MKKVLKELEGVETNIYLDSLRATLKKMQDWKIPSYNGIRRVWFKNSGTSTGPAAEQMPSRNKRILMDDEGKVYPN